MKFLIAYFYQIRFFKPYMIPFSTAVFDPKWYHMGRGHKCVFRDERGVYNGIRATPLVPSSDYGGDCSGKQNCNSNPEECKFLSNYYLQLKQLDFNAIINRMEKMSLKVKALEKFEEEPIAVLMVYEKPDNPCSERVMLRKWFKDNGYDLDLFEN